MLANGSKHHLLHCSFTYFVAFIYTLKLTIPHPNPLKTSFAFELTDPIIPRWLKRKLAQVHSKQFNLFSVRQTDAKRHLR